MIVEYIQYRIPRERQRQFEEAYANASRSLNASKHCHMYELTHSAEEPELYILRIEWDSLDGHMKGFRSSPELETSLGTYNHSLTTYKKCVIMSLQR
jgi:heme-degrading monooxygenase HmoA